MTPISSTAETIKRMIGDFQVLLESVTADPLEKRLDGYHC